MKWKDLIELDNLCNASPLASIVFCCKSVKNCSFRKEALDILGISEEEYTRVKEEHSIEAKGTCYGNLAYCCSLSVHCEARDEALRNQGMTPQDYLKYKFKLFKKLIPEDKVDVAMRERVSYMFAFEMVNLHDGESGYRGICIGNPELVDVVAILNYQQIKPKVDASVRDAIKKEKILSVRVNREVYSRLVSIASESGCSVSDLVREAIDIYVSMSAPPKPDSNLIVKYLKECNKRI